MINYQTDKAYIQYIEDVLSGKEIAGWFVRKACERAKSWFSRDDLEMHYDEVDNNIRMVQKIKQQKGLQAGKPFILLPFQQFIFMNIFGWYYKGTDRRVISKVLLMMARQTGKSYTAAALSLAIALDRTLPTPTIDYIANSSQQAQVAFDHCKAQCLSLDPKGKLFSTYRTQIRVAVTGAKINVLSSETANLHGRASYFISDEIHMNRNWELWETMTSGQGSLKNPLAIGISTAGYYIGSDYPLYSMWEHAKTVLNGDVDDDEWFYLIFQLDEEDDWHDEKVWKKAVPTLGIAVDEQFMRKRIQEAVMTPGKEVDVKTLNLNMWVNSARTWIPQEKIKEVTQRFDYQIFNADEDFSVLGVDIAERSDLCAVTSLVEKDDIIYLKAHPFICRNAYENSPNKDYYRQWVRAGYMTLVDADSIDIDYVIKLVEDLNEQVPVALIGYDQWHAQQFRIAAEKKGLPMRAVKQGLGSFAEPTSILEHLIYTKKVVIDDSPVTRWCFSNVLIKTDENDNKKPIKANQNQKIDIVIAFIQSIKLWMEVRGIMSDEQLQAVVL